MTTRSRSVPLSWVLTTAFAVLLALVVTATPAGARVDEGAAAEVRASEVTLGLRRHSPPYGRGWGRVEPRVVYNGGVPSGLARRIEWTRWGKGSAFGRGKTSAYHPDGNYYPRPVRIVFKATRMRTCQGHGAYTVLKFKAQRRPGGAMPRRWSTWTTNMCQPWEYA